MNKVKRNDLVLVTTGRDRGKTGEVRRVIPDAQRVVIQGVNIRKHHRRPRTMNEQAGIIESEGPIHWSNVRVICKACNKPTRIGFRVRDDGAKVRVCKNCEQDID
jgi:large subunit ribosomal protein L24